MSQTYFQTLLKLVVLLLHHFYAMPVSLHSVNYLPISFSRGQVNVLTDEKPNYIDPLITVYQNVIMCVVRPIPLPYIENMTKTYN